MVIWKNSTWTVKAFALLGIFCPFILISNEGGLPALVYMIPILLLWLWMMNSPIGSVVWGDIWFTIFMLLGLKNLYFDIAHYNDPVWMELQSIINNGSFPDFVIWVRWVILVPIVIPISQVLVSWRAYKINVMHSDEDPVSPRFTAGLAVILLIVSFLIFYPVFMRAR